MQKNKNWVYKSETGKVLGPYNTTQMEKFIFDGVLEGNEQVCEYPSGEWKSLSQNEVFYEKILESLERKPILADAVEKMEAETVIIVPDAILQVEIKKEQTKTIKTKTSTLVHRPISTALPKNPLLEKANDKTWEGFSSIKMEILIPGLFILAAIFILIYTFVPNENAVEVKDKIHIQGLRGKTTITPDQAKMLMAQALQMIIKDSFTAYLEAQDKLLLINQSDSATMESRGMLCMVHKELWPYAYQDTQDLKTLNEFSQVVRTANLASPFGKFCEVTKAMMLGQYKEAKGAVDSMLESFSNFSLVYVLFNYKGELLVIDQDYKSAELYLEKAQQLWDWPKPSLTLAEMYFKNNEFLKSRNALKTVLEKNPQHKIAKIFAGIVYFKGFNQSEESYNLLRAGFNIQDKVPKRIEAQGYYYLANIELEKSDQKLAKQHAEMALKLNPTVEEYKDLVLRLGGEALTQAADGFSDLIYNGDQFFKTGNFLAAQAEYKAAFELNSKSGLAAMKAAKSLWQLNQSFEAIQWLNKAMIAEPDMISSYVLQADYLSQRYDYSMAGSVLSKAIRMSPRSFEVLRGMSILEFRKNNMIAAIQYGERAKAIYDGDIDTYTTLALANLNLASSIVSNSKKELEKKQKAFQDTIKYATKATELDSTNIDAQIVYAKVIAAANGVDFGINHLNDLIQKYSSSTEYRLAMAELYKSEERYNQAKTYYEQVVNLDPKSKKGFLGLGECLRVLGLNNEAIKAFLSAAISDPTDGEAIFQIGKIKIEENLIKEAIELFKRVQKVNPNFPRTDFYIGKAAFLSGDLQTAEEYAKKEKKKNPNLSDAYILMAEIYSTKKMYSECASEYAQAMRLRNQGVDIYIKSAQCYRKSGALEIARDMLDLASSRESGNAEVFKEMALIYEGHGNLRSAIQSYSTYLELSPNAADKNEVEAKLRKWRGNGN